MSRGTEAPVADITVTPCLVQEYQILAVGIMYIANTPLLIAIATHLDFTLSSSLMKLDLSKSSRAAATVKIGLDEMI